MYAGRPRPACIRARLQSCRATPINPCHSERGRRGDRVEGPAFSMNGSELSTRRLLRRGATTDISPASLACPERSRRVSAGSVRPLSRRTRAVGTRRMYVVVVRALLIINSGFQNKFTFLVAKARCRMIIHGSLNEANTMPTTTSLNVQDLKLDLRNFRTVPQPNESGAITALVSINPDWFWALTESILADGYHPTENILVLATGKGVMEVKEGNRRIAALKLVHGYARPSQVIIPSNIQASIDNLSETWKNTNRLVPCAVYQPSEAAAVDRIVTLTHGKGEKAGRDPWGAVPRARHNRDQNSASEPGLDLLEKYLKSGLNITPAQKQRWAGEYSLSVLDEAIKRIAPRMGLGSARELADKYPKIKYRDALEQILHDIGSELLGFEQVRTADFAVTLGIPAPANQSTASGSASSSTQTQGASGTTQSTAQTKASGKRRAVGVNDPQAVSRALKKFKPVGNNREKVVTLLAEAKTLNVAKHPHAFCFVLRSMFELSAKA